MDGSSSNNTPATLAKGALRRLALAKLEPTPANFARAYAEESGAPLPPTGLPARAKPQIERLVARATEDGALRVDLSNALLSGRVDDLQRALDRSAAGATAQAHAWASLIDRLARALERGSKQWTAARKKESLQRVLDGSRSDTQRLQQRLSQLMAAWENGGEEATDHHADHHVDTEHAPALTPKITEPATAVPPPVAQHVVPPIAPPVAPPVAPATVPKAPAAPAEPVAISATEAASPTAPAPAAPSADVPAEAPAAERDHHPQMTLAFNHALRCGLPLDEPRAVELADDLAVLARDIEDNGATASAAMRAALLCERAERLFAHRHHLVDELMQLCRSLSGGLADLAENGSWAQGQSQALVARLDEATGARAVHAARELLEQTRAQQRHLRDERDHARDALKVMIQSMLQELGDLDSTTGRFNDNVSRYAGVIEQADTLESLAGVVSEMVGETRAVHEVVSGARDRLSKEHSRGLELESKVRELESELRRLSDEVATDALTQVANRRGMAQAFDQEVARIERGAAAMAVALIDIDNFKRLNDSLGHAAGDEALKSLAARVKEWLRPIDHVARFGGEEFVVMLPETPVEEAQQVLSRLQRRLTASLFMHEGKDVFVTFSAGVTAHRQGESLELALERADEALYQAKNTGKNRTCIS